MKHKQSLTSPLPPNLSRKDPALLTLDEYLTDSNPEDKHHPSNSYDSTVVSLNTDYELREAGSYALKSGGVVVVRQTSKGQIYAEKDSPQATEEVVIGVNHQGTLYTNRRHLNKINNWAHTPRGMTKWDLGKTKLVKYPQDYTKLVSHLAANNLKKFPHLMQHLVIKGTPYTLRAEAVPREGEGTRLVLLNSMQEVVASAQDEWGATLLMVAREYRGKGLGVGLGKIWMDLNPLYPSGGYTNRGKDTAIKLWESRVKHFLSQGWYSELVKNGTLTAAQVNAITQKLPKSKPKPDVVRNKPRPDKPLIYANNNTFIIYDAQFISDQDEKWLYAYGFFRSDRGKTFLYTIDYERRFQKAATLVALQMARDEGTPVYVGEGYGDMLEWENVPGVVQNGDYIELGADALPLSNFARKEKAIRKSADRFGELETTLLEMSESKWL